MDVKFINPFVIATKTVFKTMLKTEMTLEKPVLKNNRDSSSDITGIMSLVGDAKGTVCLCFSKKGALFVYKTLIGDDHNEITSEVVDAVGELTNITSGQARKEFEKNSINLKAGIPTVIVGKDVELHFISALPIVSLPFTFQLDGVQEVIRVEFSFE